MNLGFSSLKFKNNNVFAVIIDHRCLREERNQKHLTLKNISAINRELKGIKLISLHYGNDKLFKSNIKFLNEFR